MSAWIERFDHEKSEVRFAPRIDYVNGGKVVSMAMQNDGPFVQYEVYAASQARLSEAVKVLEPLVQYLEDDGPILASDIDMLAKAKAFLATLGEER